MTRDEKEGSVFRKDNEEKHTVRKKNLNIKNVAINRCSGRAVARTTLPTLVYCFAVLAVVASRLGVLLSVATFVHTVVLRTHVVQYFGGSTSKWLVAKTPKSTITKKKNIFDAHQVGFEGRAQKGGEGEKHPRQVGRSEGEHPQQIHPHVLVSPVRVSGSGWQRQDIRVGDVRVRVSGPGYQDQDVRASMPGPRCEGQDIRVRIAGSGCQGRDGQRQGVRARTSVSRCQSQDAKVTVSGSG